MSLLRMALRNKGLRHVLGAWVVAQLGQWAFTILLAIYAYAEGGPGAVGLAAAARLLPAALAAPSIALAADRHSRRAVLGTSLVVRSVTLSGMAIAAAAGAPLAVVLALAAAFTVAGTAHKPAQAALIAHLARTPSELAAANVLWSGTDYAAFLGGSLLAGVLAQETSFDVAFGVCAVAFLLAGALLLGVPRDRRPEALVAPARSDVIAGARAIVAHPGMRVLTALYAADMLVQAMLDVLIVIAALELLGLGDAGPGWLSAAWGAGGIAGGLLSGWLVARRRLTGALILGLLLGGLPLVAIGVTPEAGIAYAALVATGVGFGLIQVQLLTLVQRVAPDDVLARVFGVQETLEAAAATAGSVLAALLASAFGADVALIATGFVLPLAGVFAWRRRRTFGAGAEVPERAYALLRQVPLLAHLPMATLETLAVRSEWEEAPAGATVIRQGDHGVRFYVVAEGSADIVADGRVVAETGPGGFFGEIALLRDAPRMATVRARTGLLLLTLDRADLLAGVGSHQYTTLHADGIVASRLGEIELERAAAAEAPAP